MAHPTRESVQRLADGILAGQLDPMVGADDAWLRGDADAACELLLAAAAAGRPPDASRAGPLLPEISDIDLLPILVGACGGDRVAMLLDVVEQDRMSDERDALALFLAVELRGEPPPPRLAALLRTRARRFMGPEASILLALAVKALGDPAVNEVARDLLPMAAVVEARPMRARLLRLLATAPLATLPERAAPRAASGFTVRRPSPKIGRNEPCPCGSGKKYKRCCEAKDAERAADPSPVAGLTHAEYLRTAGPQITAAEIDQMHPAALSVIDLSTLATGPLISALRRATSFSRFELAERAMEALASRPDLPDGDPDGYRAELISDAVRAGRPELAERHLGLLRDRTAALPSDVLALELRRPSERTIGRLEEQAAIGLGDPRDGSLVELAHALLDVSPALGILVARGSLDAGRWLDSGVLLDKVEEARDRLGLLPGDPARDLYELMLESDAARGIEELGRRVENTERERLADEAEALRAGLQESRARIGELERGLRAQQEALAQPRVGAPPSRPAIAPQSPAPLDDEGRRLRSKVLELKQLLSERNEERAQLRQQLAQVSDAMAKDSPPERPARVDEEQAADWAAIDPPRSLLVPSFSSDARATLCELPDAVSRKAVMVAASLAAGEGTAWRQVKRMAAASSTLFSCRVGIHHRALFRVESNELVVLDVIHRKDLDAAIKRHGRA